MRARRWAAVTAAATAVLSVSSCGLVPHHRAVGPPAPPGPPIPAELAGLPLGNAKETGMSLSAASASGPQGTDPCALHDPAAAAQATGQPADQLQPGRELNQCELRTGDWMSSSWTLTATTAAPFSAGMARRSAPATLGGLPVQRVELAGQCEYYHQTGPGIADRLSVSSGGTDKPPAGESCRVGAHYLAAVAPRWAHPARRADHASTPEIQLGRSSPCAAMHQVITQIPPLPGSIPGKTRVVQDDFGEPDPSQCTMYDQLPLGGTSSGEESARAKISYVVSPPPGGAGQPLQVAGHPAEAMPSDDNGCTVNTQAEPTTITPDPHEPSDTLTPEIETKASTCENAASVAESALRSAGQA